MVIFEAARLTDADSVRVWRRRRRSFRARIGRRGAAAVLLVTTVAATSAPSRPPMLPVGESDAPADQSLRPAEP